MSSRALWIRLFAGLTLTALVALVPAVAGADARARISGGRCLATVACEIPGSAESVDTDITCPAFAGCFRSSAIPFRVAAGFATAARIGPFRIITAGGLAIGRGSDALREIGPEGIAVDPMAQDTVTVEIEPSGPSEYTLRPVFLINVDPGSENDPARDALVLKVFPDEATSDADDEADGGIGAVFFGRVRIHSGKVTVTGDISESDLIINQVGDAFTVSSKPGLEYVVAGIDTSQADVVVATEAGVVDEILPSHDAWGVVAMMVLLLGGGIFMLANRRKSVASA